MTETTQPPELKGSPPIAATATLPTLESTANGDNNNNNNNDNDEDPPSTNGESLALKSSDNTNNNNNKETTTTTTTTTAADLQRRFPRRSRKPPTEVSQQAKIEKPPATKVVSKPPPFESRSEEQLDPSDKNRLIEGFQYIPSTGQYYPHHGRLLEILPRDQRIPQRWSVQWMESQRQDEWTKADLEHHDALLRTGQNPFGVYNARRPEKNRPKAALKNALETIDERHKARVLQALEESNLLPTLLMMASFEDALQTSLQFQQEQSSSSSSSFQEQQVSQRTNKKNHLPPHPPQYYMENPHSYLLAPTKDALEDEERTSLHHHHHPKSVLTPAVLAQRLREGCQWAYKYLLQEQPQGLLREGPDHSSIKASWWELQAKDQSLVETTAASEEIPRRSVRSGDDSRRSTRGLFVSYDESKCPPPNLVQKGGRVALWWIQELEKTKQTNEPAKPKEEKSLPFPKPVVIKGESYEEAMPQEEDEGKTDDDDEDFEVPKTNTDDDDSESALVDLAKEGSLSPIPDDDDSSSEDEDEEDHILWKNPFFQPLSKASILEYLAKPKSISGEDIQTVMDQLVLRLKHNKRSTKFDMFVSQLESCDKTILHWENPKALLDPNDSLSLKCISGESPAELQKLDAQTFGRCKFQLELIGSEEESIQAMRLQDFEQRSEDYKQRKQHDRWRYKGIHEGHALWPSWKDIWSTPPKQMEESSSSSSDKALAQALEEEGTGGRRSRRGMHGTGKSEGSVFYGNQSNMTQKQLMDALVRLVKSRPLTMVELQQLVADDSSDPLRRIRIALGKIVWKRNLLQRRPTTTEESDGPLWKSLGSNHSLLALPEAETSREAQELIDYLKQLHITEIRLRNLVLQHLGRIPLAVLATSADERTGSMENMDATDFEEASTIEWSSTGDHRIGQLVYRPKANSLTSMVMESTPCHWYQIQDFSDGIPSDADDAEPGSMERRKRFRAYPHSSSESNGEVLILTEAQVHAGKIAGQLQRQRETATSTQMGLNPFATEIGDKITLVAVDGDHHEISGRVVGHDSAFDSEDEEDADVEYRILILPDNDQSKTAAFWAILDIRADDASFVCQPEGDNGWYSIENQDFNVDSEPYKACESILDWLCRQSKAMPFMEPVDPVALGIPSYPEIVKHPMDVSTMREKLEQGAYSTIPPGQSFGNSLVSRMLNGPFRKDLELIFDNAMLFNPPDDWIHLAASALKKSVLKKIETATHAAERKSGASQRKSMYADEDSDVDMYEYESENDEDYTRRGKRKRSNARSSTGKHKDEVAARPMEHPIKLQNCLKDGNDLRGRFANLPINGSASTYSMPPGWTCRKAIHPNRNTDSIDDENEATSEDPAPESTNQEYVQEMAELLALQKEFGEVQSSSLRRSSRETRPSAGRRSETSSRNKNALSNKTEGLEYYLRTTSNGNDAEANGDVLTIPSSRLDLEQFREKRHEEHYAKLYQRYESELTSTGADGTPKYGLYTNGSFPPYLGRVVPSKNSYKWTWEIRPAFCVPALRWVLRGLVQSGHLTAIEPMSVGGAGASNNDTSAGTIITNDVYYWDNETTPFEILDTRELQRRKRAGVEENDSSEDEVELSEYEKLRAERVARNAERLKALGLA